MKTISLIFLMLLTYLGHVNCQTCPSSIQPKNQHCIKLEFAGGEPSFLPTDIENLGPGAGTGNMYSFLPANTASQLPTADPWEMYFGTGSMSCNNSGYMGNAGNYVVTFDNNVSLNCSYDDGGIILPITLNSLTITKDDGAILEWITSSEINNDYFSVERSKDGKSFDILGQVKGAGQSKVDLSYSFWDPKPFSGISYYRIVQYDFNGSSTSSELLTFRNFDGEDQVFYQQGKAKIEIFNAQENISFAISNINGSVISRGQLSAERNTIDVAEVTPGMYFVTLIGQEVKSFKVLVTR